MTDASPSIRMGGTGVNGGYGEVELKVDVSTSTMRKVGQSRQSSSSSSSLGLCGARSVLRLQVQNEGITDTLAARVLATAVLSHATQADVLAVMADVVLVRIAVMSDGID